ncbi:sigma-70 family RNA polymerase sigma factor [Leucobacter sp. NPDC077196]|uniref:sigma-70 family RNA polymerase sigma factor n=1 Tax=Leucobacter sp. NPDC077196 TaxID=3154959 RepID=UPI00341356F5
MADQQHDSDEDLLSAYRAGDSAALAVLWERHLRPALVASRSIAPSLDAEDVVSDAYLKIIESIENGRGPQGAFRPYLYRVVRSVAVDKLRNPESHASALHDDHELPEVDPWHDDAFDRGAAAQAFNALNERWQSVLWYTEVEGLAPREVADLLGIRPNAVSALAARAREALASAWVEAHVNRELASAECESTLNDLQRYQRGKLTSARSRAVQAHLETCRSCAAAADEIAVMNRKLALILATIFVGGGAATSLLGGFNSSTPAAAHTGGTMRKHLSSAPAQTAIAAGVSVIGIAAVVTAVLALSSTTAPVEAADSRGVAAAPHASHTDAEAPQDEDAEEDPDSETRSDEAEDLEDGGDDGEREDDGAQSVFIEIFGSGGDGAPAPSEGSSTDHEGAATSLGAGDASADADADADADAASNADGDSSGDGSSDASSAADSTGDASAEGAGSSTAEAAADTDANGDSGGEPVDDADPALLAGFTCYAENPAQGYVLTGTASEAGALQARIAQPPSTVPVPLIAYPTVEDSSGVTFHDVLTGTDPEPNPWWWTPSLTPLSQWDGLHDAPVSDVTIELRLLSQDGRHSPWTVVTPNTLC